jgi:hypothetical protein
MSHLYTSRNNAIHRMHRIKYLLTGKGHRNEPELIGPDFGRMLFRESTGKSVR